MADSEDTQNIAVRLELQQQEFERNARGAAAAIDRLERKFDPLAAAEYRLTKEQLRFNAALEVGKISAERHARGMELLQKQYDRTVQKLTDAKNKVLALNSNVAAQNGFLTRNRAVLQQAGYQVGDFAVQVQGGTSAVTAFTQQGSQLLGVMGPWGAVLGAVLAIGAPLAAALYGMGDATEETKEKAKTFKERVDEANAALATMASNADFASAGGLETLRKKYGELTQEVRDMAVALYEIDRRHALAEVSAVISEVTAEIAKASEASAGAVTAALAAAGSEAGRAEAEAYRQEVDRIAADIANRQNAGFQVSQTEIENLRVMRQELAALEGRFEDIGELASEVKLPPELLNQLSEAQTQLRAAKDAADFSAVADQFGIIRDLLIEAGEIIGQDIVDKVTLAEDTSRQMAEALAEGEAAASGLADVGFGNIENAANAAERLARYIRYAVEKNNNGLDVEDPRNPNGLPTIFPPERDFNSDEYNNRSKRTHSGGGVSKAQREYNDMMREAERIIAGLRTEQERYNDDVARTKELLDAGVLTQDQYNQRVAQLGEALEKATERGVDFGEEVTNSLEKIVFEAGNAKEALGQLLNVAARSLFRSAISSSGIGDIVNDVFGAGAGPVVAAAASPALANVRSASSASASKNVTVRVLGGDLMLSDSGQIMTRIQVMQERTRRDAIAGADRAMQKTKAFGSPR